MNWKQPNIFYTTYCSRKKTARTEPAFRLYTGQHVQDICNLATLHNVGFLILSWKHGLIDGDKRLQPYDCLLTESMVAWLVLRVRNTLRSLKVTKLIYFTESTDIDKRLHPYLTVITTACKQENIPLEVEEYKTYRI